MATIVYVSAPSCFPCTLRRQNTFLNIRTNNITVLHISLLYERFRTNKILFLVLRHLPNKGYQSETGKNTGRNVRTYRRVYSDLRNC